MSKHFKTLNSGSRGYTTLAWIVIIGMIVWILWQNHTATLNQATHHNSINQAAELAPDLQKQAQQLPTPLLVVSGIMGLAGIFGLFAIYFVCKYGHFQFKTYGNQRHGVYAEGFAIWMVFFWSSQKLIALFSNNYAPGYYWALTGSGFFLSSLACYWFRFRGFSSNDTKIELGLTKGEGIKTELLYGLLAFCMGAGLTQIGNILTYLIFGGLNTGTLLEVVFAAQHPVVFAFKKASAFELAQIFIVLTLCAGIVEEYWFRGVLLRHLREWTSLSSRMVSLAVSLSLNTILTGLLGCFIFAIIHPQGLPGVLPLMGTAFGLTLVRELRNSLIAPMTGHAINNGMFFLMILMMR